MSYSMNLDDERAPKKTLPEGWRVFKILAGREQVSKAGNEMIVFNVEDVISGYYEEVYCVTQKGKRWTLKSILVACGIPRNEDGNYNWEIKDLAGKEILGLVEHQPNDYINRNGETVKGFQHKINDFKKYVVPEPAKEVINEKDVAWND